MGIGSLYRLVNGMHRSVPYYLSPSARAFPPWHFVFEVTRRCNLRCKMCQNIEWLKQIPVAAQREGELTTEEWFNVIDQVPRLGLITFTGGEPFLRDDFMQLLERSSAQCRTHFISNGVLLNDESAGRCVALAPKRLGGVGLNFAGISIDGPAEVHDHIRGIQGGFDRSTHAIKMLTELRRRAGKKCPLVHVTACIQEDNVDFLAQMPQVVADAGADVLNLTIENRVIGTIRKEAEATKSLDSYDVSEMPFPSLEPERVKAALGQTRIAAEKAGIELRMPAMPDSEIIRYYQGHVKLEDFVCRTVWSDIFVNCTGDICPGCPFVEVGNVREVSVKEIWNGSNSRRFRRSIRSGLLAACIGCCSVCHRGQESP